MDTLVEWVSRRGKQGRLGLFLMGAGILVLLSSFLPQRFFAIAGGIVLGVGLGLVVLEALFQADRSKQSAASVRDHQPKQATREGSPQLREVPQTAEKLADGVAKEAKKVVSLVRRKTRSQANRGKSVKKDIAG